MVETLRESLGVLPPSAAAPYINLLLYGDPGVGKTLFCGTAIDLEETSPVLFLDCEAGTRTLASPRFSAIDVKTVKRIKDMSLIYNELEKEDYYKTVIIDSLGELQRLDMNDIMREQFNRKPETTDIDVPSVREWGKTQVHIRNIVRAYRDLPCNTLFTCHAKTSVEDESTGYVKFLPSLPGKLATEIAGFVDIVGYMYVKAERVVLPDKTQEERFVRKMLFQSNGTYMCKDRTDALGQVVEEPTVPKLWSIIQGEPI